MPEQEEVAGVEEGEQAHSGQLGPLFVGQADPVDMSPNGLFREAGNPEFSVGTFIFRC